MCMTKPYMFLSCVIPDPFNPMVDIDVYLQPLIDDLKKLWSGVLTYDVSRTSRFEVKSFQEGVNDAILPPKGIG